MFRLHSNLTNIETIVATANSSLSHDVIGAFGPQIYDTKSLTDIIGNFQLTLEECRSWLNDDSKFRKKDGFITNIIYNLNVDPQVVRLTERLAFHSTKVGLVLDPFNIHIQTQLRDLNKEQHQDIAELLQELKQLLISGRSPGAEAPSLLIRRDLEVPPELCVKFATELNALLSSSTSSTEAHISVKDGLEVFFVHFNGISEVGDSMSYLRLMKSIWIMDMIKESDDWHRIEREQPGGLYHRCVREMDRRLRAECSRTVSNPIARSRQAMVLQLPEHTFAIWPKAPNGQDLIQSTHLGVLLDVPILPNMKSHTLRVVKNMDGTLGIEDTTTTITESASTTSSEKIVQRVNIDLGTAFLVPLYATPLAAGSRPPSCVLKLQSSRDGFNGVMPEFKTTSDLFKLQHLVTGYRCVKQRCGQYLYMKSESALTYSPRKGITVTSLVKGQGYYDLFESKRESLRKASVLSEDGNLQFWQKSPFEKAAINQDIQHGPARSSSDTSSPTTYGSRKWPRTPSLMSSQSSVYTQTISQGSSYTAVDITRPEPPLLVLLLRVTKTGHMSFLVIELDERTKVEPNSCDCRSSKKTCTTSVLERSGTPLFARRFYAGKELNRWNLAAVGEYWTAKNSESVQVRDMYWLRIAFASDSERIKFNSNLTDLVRIYSARVGDYQEDLKAIKGVHIVSQDA